MNDPDGRLPDRSATVTVASHEEDPFLLALLAVAAAVAGTKRKDDVKAGAAKAQSTLTDAAKTAKEKVKPSADKAADSLSAAADDLGDLADVAADAASDAVDDVVAAAKS